ncbi:MAG: UvrD-helicase domain-containing protein, partial [Lachnospiraceae bacterium]|nr:UvrD-helicase domain-containing protein [Lachnospiraceae bacterium]
ELILQLYESAGNAPDPDAWLDSCAGSVPQDPDAFYAQDWLAPFDESLRRDLAEAEAWALRLSARCEEEDLSWAARYRDLAREDAAVIRFVLDQPDLRRRKAALQSASFARWPAARKGDDKDFAAWFRRERGSAQGYLKLFQEAGAVWTQESEAEEIRHVKMTEEPVRTLVRLTRAYAERLRAALREKNLTSFAQMEHDTLSLLRQPGGPGAARTPLAEELSQQFDEIIVDEYQDINAVQESILSALSGEESGRPNLFMVGDIKQSIYRFRRARAEIFLEKYRRFTYGPGPHQKIDLDTNFRSRRSVLDFANAVFSRIMTADLGGIVYDEAAALKYGASYEGPDPAAEWLVAEGGQDAEYEAAALRVQELLQSGETVYDLKTGRHEPIRPGHIVILSPVLSGVAGKLVKALQARGIAASAAEKNGFFNSQEIRTMTAVLQCVDDPLQDIPLAAVLLSPLGGFSDEDLARIHAAARGESFLWQRLRRAFDEEPGRFGRAGAFLEKLARWRALSDRLPVAELLSAILEESGYDLYLRAMPEGSVRLENIRRLILLAEQYEKTSYSGLYRFISYIERQK